MNQADKIAAQNFGPLLVWRRASPKRFCADLGPLALEVVRHGAIKSGEKPTWAIGKVFGEHWRGNSSRFAEPVDAQIAAESVAVKLLLDARCALPEELASIYETRRALRRGTGRTS